MVHKTSGGSVTNILERYKVGERDFRGEDLSNANLEKANLSGADLRKANFEGASLRGALLGGANLRNANLGDADLTGANLIVAKLWDANLENANLQEAILWFSRLSGSNLKNANLTGARLENAYFGDVVLASASNRIESKPAMGIEQAQIEKAYGNAYTALPAGLERPEHWNTTEAAGSSGDKGEQDETATQPSLVLKFKGDARPGTLQELSRDTAAWTDYLRSLATLEKCAPFEPSSDYRKGSLILTVLPPVTVLTAFGAIWSAVAIFRESSAEIRTTGAPERIEKMKDELLVGLCRRLKKETPEEKRTINYLFNAFLHFAQDGGEARINAPERSLETHPELRELISKIGGTVT